MGEVNTDSAVIDVIDAQNNRIRAKIKNKARGRSFLEALGLMSQKIYCATFLSYPQVSPPRKIRQ
jgi:hypothetical protein